MSNPAFSRTVIGTGPAIALAHGMGGSVAAHYGLVLAGLAAHHTVIGVDYPGSGLTPRATEPLMLDQLADAIVSAAIDEGFDTFALIGFSLGGPVAIRAAARHPDRISALIVTGGFPYNNTYMNFANAVSGELLGTNPALFGKVATLFSLSPATMAMMPPEMLDQSAAGAAAGLASGTPEQAALFATADVRDDLPRIKVPTLLIAPTEDRVVPIGLQREMVAAIPGARLAEIDAGHLVLMERSAEWLSLVTGFLAEVEAQPTE